MQFLNIKNTMCLTENLKHFIENLLRVDASHMSNGFRWQQCFPILGQACFKFFYTDLIDEKHI